jgi:aminoglycoside 6-adenylyltransferase
VVRDSTTVQRLLAWAASDESVRAVFLVGSRGQADAHADRLSDYDVLLFVRDTSRLEADGRWLNAFGTILVKLHEGYEFLGTRVPTRLVQYRDGAKIDFSICGLGLLEGIAEQPRLPDIMDAGFQVLIDKDDSAARLPEASGRAYRVDIPDESVYEAVVNEFWWEVIYVAKHLARGELIPALYNHECVVRFRCLVPMLEWYARVVHRSEERLGPYGRGLERELRKEEVDRLRRTILGRTVGEAWEALFETTELFRNVSKKVAQQLGFATPDGLVEGVDKLLDEIRDDGSQGA